MNRGWRSRDVPLKFLELFWPFSHPWVLTQNGLYSLGLLDCCLVTTFGDAAKISFSWKYLLLSFRTLEGRKKSKKTSYFFLALFMLCENSISNHTPEARHFLLSKLPKDKVKKEEEKSVFFLDFFVESNFESLAKRETCERKHFLGFFFLLKRDII